MKGKHNIRVNCVVPVATSRMTADVLPPSMQPLLDPVHVVPLVTYLASDACERSGQCYEVGGGWYSQVRIQRSRGVRLQNANANAEGIASSLDAIEDFSIDPTYPTTPADALKAILAPSTPTTDSSSSSHAAPVSSTAPSNVNNEVVASSSATSSSSEGLKSDMIFTSLQHIIANDSKRS